MKKSLILVAFFILSNFTYSQVVKKVVVEFYKWYAANDAKLYNFKLYKGKVEKDAPPYMIDWKVAEKYFNYINKNVPWLGQAFVANERKFLKQCQQSFNKYPEAPALMASKIFSSSSKTVSIIK